MAATSDLRELRRAILAVAFCCVGCSTASGEQSGYHVAYQPVAVDGGVTPALRSVKGSGPGNAWAVGEQGAAVHMKDGKWSAVVSGSDATLGGISVVGGSAFAVDNTLGRVLAWNGRGWAALGTDASNRTATWASSATDVWVVGDGIEHWDGANWSQAVPGGAGLFTSVAGSFPTDVWAVGAAGIRHLDGGEWKTLASPTTAALSAVWASNPHDAWIVGAQGTVLHWDGSTLARLESGTTKDLTAVSGTGLGDVWIGGQDGILVHWDGSWSQTVTPSAQTINDVWAAFGAGVYVVDGSGVIFRFVP